MENKKLTQKEQKLVEDAIEKLLSLLEIEGTFEVATKEDHIDVLLETQDTGMVIGYHGEALDSLQLIFSLIISKKIGRFLRTSIEVDDYKKNRTEYLEKLAEQTKEKVLAENKEQPLYSLKPWERRIVHLHLEGDEKVISESSGEGKERFLIIKPKA
jgi:spoIIIJ-associated protein